MATAIEQKRFRVEGMDCAACAAKIDVAARHVAGIDDVNVSVAAGTMVVKYASGTDLVELQKRVKHLGYKIFPAGSASPELSPARAHHHDHGDDAAPIWKSQKTWLTVASGIAFIVAYAVGKAWPAEAPWAFIAATLMGLIPVARRAVMGALQGSPFSIETLLTIAAVGAIIINASEEAAAVVFLFLVGEMLEGVAAGCARDSIKSLTNLVPKIALLIENGKSHEVPADTLNIDDAIMVRPGDRIPADGVILSGSSAVDESPVTGESTPARRGQGDRVYAGTINSEAVLNIRVTATAADNTIARVVALVEEAQESKAPTERFIDRFSRYYTPAVLVVGALIAVVPPLLHLGGWDEWVYKGLAVLLIGCPCALVISTPAAIAASLSAGARRGMLMKGGLVLETLGKVTVVALDKTGTLTAGKPEVTDVVALNGRDKDTVLGIAAALEAGSSHPLARAILEKAKELPTTAPQATDAAAVPGKGVTGRVDGVRMFLGSIDAAREEAQVPAKTIQAVEALNQEGKTVSAVVADGQLAGLIAMRDEPRGDARAGLALLKRLGASAIMLTGDNERTAKAIASDLGIEARAGLMPEDKQRIVNELKAQGRVVAKVGDGINDAPALAAADVGIAMGGGTDVALETADAAVLHGRVLDVGRMIELSRATMSNIRQNITIALGLKAVFLVTTVMGLTGLWPAILADTGATVLVTANAMRLLGWKGSDKAQR